MANENKVPDFNKITADVLKKLPADVSELAKAFFESSFDKEGFTDISFIGWPKRKDTEGHRILNKTSALKNSIKITEATLKRIEIQAGEGLPYAAIQNNGGVITVRITEKSRKFFWYMFKKTTDEKWKYMALTKKNKLNITIPQRQYIGESDQLLKDIDALVIKSILTNFKIK